MIPEAIRAGVNQAKSLYTFNDTVYSIPIGDSEQLQERGGKGFRHLIFKSPQVI